MNVNDVHVGQRVDVSKLRISNGDMVVFVNGNAVRVLPFDTSNRVTINKAVRAMELYKKLALNVALVRVNGSIARVVCY